MPADLQTLTWVGAVLVALVAAAGNSGSVASAPTHQTVRVTSGTRMRVPIETTGASKGGVQVWVTLRSKGKIAIGLDSPDGTWIDPVDEGGRLKTTTLREFIDWSPFFHSWELRGRWIAADKRFSSAHEDAEMKVKAEAEALKLYNDAQSLLDRIIAEKRFQARGVFGFFPANSVGDDIEVYESGKLKTTFHTLRQQLAPGQMTHGIVTEGGSATNVIPGTLDMLFNFRFGTASRAEDLMQRTEAVLVKHGLDYRIEWSLSGAPYLTEPGALIDAVRHAVRKHTGIDTRADTGGGTSDGRFVATLGAQVVELGPVNATIHMVDENVLVSDLEKLPDIYFDVAKRLLVV